VVFLRYAGRVATVAVLLGACAQQPPREPAHPMEHSESFAAMNARIKGNAPPVVRDVTFERLLRARSEPHNWLTYYGAYDGQRYSGLDQINIGNVKNLRPAWTFQHGMIGLLAAPATYSF